MRNISIASVLAGVIIALAASSDFPLAYAQTGGADKSAHLSTESLSEPVYEEWPLPATGKAYGVIDGKHLWQYVKEQAAISEHYRDKGHPQYWGRITGTSGDVESAQWLLEKYRQIGLTDIHSQTLALFDPQWAPESWEVTASASGQTLELTSAQPPYAAVSTNGKVLDVPIVYVGLGSEADFAGRDVRGKAVLIVKGEIDYAVGPADVLKRALDGGAAAILETDLRGGNYKAIAYQTNTKVPTFNLGTKDGLALRSMIGNALADVPPHVKIRLDARWASGQKSFLVWGTLPGATDETIYVVAHRDGFFDGAGDNASGVATMLGLAEYFAKVPKSQRRRTIIFIGLDGHHNFPYGAEGRVWLGENREKFFSKTALLFNAEHPSELLTHSGAAGRTEEITPMWWYAGGPSRPQLKKISLDAFHEFGVPLWVEERPLSGDIEPFNNFTPGVVVQSSGFMNMHTDGDTPDIVAWSGLEAVTRAYARIIDEVNKLPLSDLQRPPQPYKSNIDLTGCAAWISDSSVFCRRKN
jgi:Peptidase family M28